MSNRDRVGSLTTNNNEQPKRHEYGFRGLLCVKLGALAGGIDCRSLSSPVFRFLDGAVKVTAPAKTENTWKLRFFQLNGGAGAQRFTHLRKTPPPPRVSLANLNLSLLGRHKEGMANRGKKDPLQRRRRVPFNARISERQYQVTIIVTFLLTMLRRMSFSHIYVYTH
ncbi:hypothetical protein GWI33_018516 [Rhynchophorus ferrugineus]|uniref:Uncharacterized protein n=1 Tax=Rhynchophorus ferrugineus TaxID=354439 RepID=A0A834HT97_RHYFE|nr:hypothetical protein GWI33_018516 [Rhynchophorus ferrugineus]